LGQSSDSDGSGVSGGTIAGIVVGVVGGVAILVGALVWFFCRRRRQTDQQSRTSSFIAERIGGSSSGNQSNSVPSRQVSQMSQAGLLGSKAPRIQTNGLGGGLGFDTRSPDTSSNVDRRSVGTDQRLNPWAIYKQDDQASSVSLHDDRDYSRQLRVSLVLSVISACIDICRLQIPTIKTQKDMSQFGQHFRRSAPARRLVAGDMSLRHVPTT
jgi:cell wall integrity and stress response component